MEEWRDSGMQDGGIEGYRDMEMEGLRDGRMEGMRDAGRETGECRDGGMRDSGIEGHREGDVLKASSPAQHSSHLPVQPEISDPVEQDPGEQGHKHNTVYDIA